MGLKKPKSQSLPTRLEFLNRNKLIENDFEVLNNLSRKDIDSKILTFLDQKFKEDTPLEKLDFCEEDDEEDNDTDEEEGVSSEVGLKRIMEEEK